MGHLPGPTNFRGRPCSWAALCQYWSWVLTKAGAGHQVLPAGAGCCTKRGWWEQSLTGDPSGGLQKVDWVERVQGPHTRLVAGANGDPRYRYLPGAGLEGKGLFWNPLSKECTPGCQSHWAPPAPKCICQKEFLPLPNPMFPNWDFWEGQSKKTLAYTEALQYWAEMANLPMPGWPHLLAGCVQELRWVMEPYVVFANDAILEGASLRRGSQRDKPWHPFQWRRWQHSSLRK